jgi:hypothetical protein
MGTVRSIAVRAPELAPSVTLGVVEARVSDGAWRVRAGRSVHTLGCDASVDAAVIDEAAKTGARVVIDLGDVPVIVGTLATARAVTVDREGVVNVDVKRFVVTAAEEVLMRTQMAFVQVKGGDVESYGQRVVSRVRELLKVLGRNVRIN